MARASGSPPQGGCASVRLAAQAAAALGLLAAAAMPAMGQAGPPPPAEIAAPSARDAYLRRMDTEMDGWREKLRGMTDKAEATGQEAATGAETELRLAWTRTEGEARKLRAATAAGWEDAKSSYEQSSLDLSHAWSKSRL